MKLFLMRVIIVFILMFLFACGITLGVIYYASQNLPNVDVMNRFEPYLTTEIYAGNGELIGKVYAQNRLPLSWEDLPANLKNAIVAVEDSRFYSHHGVDVVGIVRAAAADLAGHGALEGASTITQQLARNLFLTPTVSIMRKIKEALLALEIERRFSKDEILLLYLNQVYFGAGSYGAQAASQTYFGKDCRKLDLAESAMLAGLPQAPSIYDPFSNFEKAKARQKEVLNRMVDLGFCTLAQAQTAYNETLHLSTFKTSYQGLRYPYFTTYILHKLLEKYPADLVYKGGLQVYTTLNTNDQRYAQEAIKKILELGRKQNMHVGEGALVAVEPSTGYIKAMVGGDEFSIGDQFNRAWQARRQPGSAFKIFDYTAALDSGYKPTSIILDSPICFPSGQGTWCPREWDNKYWGAITIKDGITWSRNTATVRLVSQIGIDKVIAYAHKMGIEEQLDPYLPTSLGASVVTPLEMAAAVVTLANQGVRVDPTPIKLIKDRNGNIVLDNTTPIRSEVLSAQTSNTMTDLMENVIAHGTGERAGIGRPAAGKTGTSSDFRDAWFVGFTPDLACVVWNGNDDNSSMKNGAYGGYLPATAWADFMKVALKDIPPHPFPFQKPKTKETKQPVAKAKEEDISPPPTPLPSASISPSPTPAASPKPIKKI